MFKALLLGFLAGIFTGLTPGIHTNTIAMLCLGSYSLLSQFFGPLEIGVFLVSMVVVHSFVDFIPSIFLGAPEAETALSILPGHKLLLEGKGYEALALTVVGGLGATVVGLPFLGALFFGLKGSYPAIQKSIPFLLLAFSIGFILSERKLKRVIWGALLFIFSGVLGLLCLNHLNLAQPLFPLLTGLFGTSTLLVSMLGKNQIVKQQLNVKVAFISVRRFIAYVKAAISSLIVSVLPAIGAAQATIIAQGFVRFKNHREFLVIVGGINTISALFVLTTLLLIGKARTGVMVVLEQFLPLDLRHYLVLSAACFAAVGLGASITLIAGRWFARNIWKMHYRKVSLAVTVFLVLLIGLFTGWLGLLILSVCTALGALAPLVGVRRIHLMGVLVIPVLLHFANF